MSALSEIKSKDYKERTELENAIVYAWSTSYYLTAQKAAEQLAMLEENCANAIQANIEVAQLNVALQEKIEELCTTNDRLITAAAGRGMVSEMDNMQEVAVLVCGLHDKIVRLENFIRTRNVVCTWCGFMVVYDNQDEQAKQSAYIQVNNHALICKKDPRNVDIKAIEANYDALQSPMPCGHLARYAVNEEAGTQYCALCELEEKQQTIDDLQEYQ